MILAIFGKIFGNMPIFDNDTDAENVPKYSTFDYWLSRYIFPKLLKILKLLPERMGLDLIIQRFHRSIRSSSRT